MLRVLIGISIVQYDWVIAQDTTAEKREPETRHLELQITPPDSIGTSVRSTMPKIELPKYVITGNTIIDLPMADKLSAQEDAQPYSVESLLIPSMTRSRQTVLSELGNKEEIPTEQSVLFNGNAFAGLGTFFSPQAGLWFGKRVRDYHYSVDGEYYRSKGFAPFTDRSGGKVGLEGGTIFNSYNPLFDQSRLSGQAAYKSDTYNWYGTRWQSISRNTTDLVFTLDLSNWTNSRFPYSVEIGVENFAVADSSANVHESWLNLGGATRFNISSVPLDARIIAHMGSISYRYSISDLAYFEGMLQSQHYSWGAISLKGSLHGYLAEGMENQRLLRLYPHLNVAYQLNSIHTVTLTYAPGILASSLSSSIFANRYLSATSRIKHIDDQYDGTLAFVSNWSPETSTKLEARVQSMVDYPLFADSLSQRVWSLAYGGRTMIASFSSEIFAKLRPNDYFAATLTARISRNSSIGSQVPYLPVVEIGCRYTRQITERLSGLATLTLIHQQKDNVVNINTMPSILLVGLRSEYRVLQQVKVFLDVQNLLDETYEYWKGYQENPFVVTLGIILRW